MQSLNEGQSRGRCPPAGKVLVPRWLTARADPRFEHPDISAQLFQGNHDLVASDREADAADGVVDSEDAW